MSPHRRLHLLVVALLALALPLSIPVPAEAQTERPSCVNPGSDPDGDGWGWENDQSCIVPDPLGRLPEPYSRSCWALEDFVAGCTMSGGPWTPEVTSHMNLTGLATPGTDLGANVQIVSDPNLVVFNQRVLYIVGPYLTADLNNPEANDFDTAAAEAAAVLTLAAPAVGDAVNTAEAQGATVIYVSFGDAPNADIPVSSRAEAVRRTIRNFERVRPMPADKAAQQTDSMVIGVSLGGLAAKQALHDLEVEGTDHGVDTYVSWDSPHNGAHIPTAIQFVPVFLKRAFDKMDEGVLAGFSDEAEDAEKAALRLVKLTLHNPVARQVLIKNIEFPNRPAPAEVFNTPYPQDPLNVAVASGSLNDVRPQFGDRILTVDTGEGRIGSELRITIDHPAIDVDASAVQTFDGELRWRKPLAFKDSKYARTRSVTNPEIVRYDGASCGIDSQVVTQLRDQLDTQLRAGWRNPSVTVGEARVCFIPTTSAIDQEWQRIGQRLAFKSKFDQVIGDSVNNEHLAVEPGTRDRVLQLVRDRLR